MTIKEKLQVLADGAPNEIYLFKEGVFWIAYEQCAYWLHLQKGYKPAKKFVKAVKQEVVSVGFPDSALAQFGADGTFEKNGKDGGDKMSVFVLKEEIDMGKFEEWKKGLPLKEKNTPPPTLPHKGGEIGTNEISETSGIIEKRIREFDLSHATPMECMMFVVELKKECRV